MNSKTRDLLKNWLPPIMLRGLRAFTCGIRWSGNYTSWTEAQQASNGYDSENILGAVREALLKIKKGDAVYERDSVLFDEMQYSWPLLAALMWIAAASKGVLNLVDFGGSLGSTYFQNRKFLFCLPKVRWNIVEQPHFVDCGKTNFEDDILSFYYDIDTCIRQVSSNTILLSGVIQYLEKPYYFLEEITNLGFEYIIFDRTAFNKAEGDRLTIQKVPEEIYKASYPAWFLNKRRFLDILLSRYEIIASWQDNTDAANIPSIFEGYIFKIKTYPM
jgi:putative methyltransferase (TIGR04325 family)